MRMDLGSRWKITQCNDRYECAVCSDVIMPDKCHTGQCSYYFGCRRGVFGSVVDDGATNALLEGFYGQDNICIIILQYWNEVLEGVGAYPTQRSGCSQY